jgi:hypothetical protein
MLATYSSAIRIDRQVGHRRHFPSRRRDADTIRVRRAAVAMRGAAMRSRSGMKPNEVTVYLHLLVDCYIMPIARQESDKVDTVANDATAIGARVGIDRSDARRAIAGLIEDGYVKEANGRIWVSARRFNELCDAAERDEEDEIRAAEMREFLSGCEGNSPGDAGENPPAPSIEHAPAHAPSRSSIQSGELNSDSGKSVYRPGSSPAPPPACAREAPPGQDDIDRLVDRKHPLPTEDEAREIQRFGDRFFPMLSVAEGLLTNCSGRFPASWFVKGMRRAYLEKKPKWKYIQGIMETWEFAGGFDAGAEDRYDLDMNPIALPPRPDVIPLPPAADRPLSLSQRNRIGADRMLATPGWFSKLPGIEIVEGGA